MSLPLGDIRMWDWGTVPDWVAAVGTVLAFFAAVGIFAFDLAHRRQEEREAQARLVAGWLVGGPGPPVTLGGGREVLAFGVRVVNRSDLPVHSAIFHLEWPDDPRSAHHHAYGTIAPGEDFECNITLDKPPVVSDFPRFSFGFKDAAGKEWRKYGDGRLEEGALPPTSWGSAEPGRAVPPL